MKDKTVSFTCLISLLCSLFIVSGIKGVAFTPTPDPPYDSVEWGVDIGYIGTWEFSRDNGTDILGVQEYSYNITGFELFYWNSTNWHVMIVKVGHYYVHNDTFDPYTSARLSFINFTDQYIYNPLSVITFLPLNNSEVMLEWCAPALLYPSPYNFILECLNGSDHILITTHKATDNNMIQYVKSTTGDYVKLFFDDEGVLVSMEAFYYDSSFDLQLTDRVTRTYPVIHNGEPPPFIPFGNSYILMMILCMTALIIYIKRKKISIL